MRYSPLTAKFNVFLFALAALLCFSGCASGVSPTRKDDAGNRRNFTDGLGRVVSIAPNPQRIISLAPNVTEILFALGLENRVAGVTSYCDFPEAAKAKEKIGDTRQPNLEKIISLKPDLVVIYVSQTDLIGRLQRVGVPTFVYRHTGLADVGALSSGV